MINQLGNLWQKGVEIVIDYDMLAWSHLILSHLGCHAVLDLLGGEAVACHHTVDAHLIGSRYVPDAIHQTVQRRRAQQRCLDKSGPCATGGLLFCPVKHVLGGSGMDNGIEPCQSLLVGKCHRTQVLPIQ